METKTYFFSLVFILFFAANSVFAQQFHRFSADYTIKYNDRSGKQVMKMGRVFYDSNKNKIVIKNGFPVKEYTVHNDTSIYTIRVGNIITHERIVSPVELSIFHLALSGQLSNYGLDKLGYTMDEVKKDKGLIIASWIPPEKYKNKLGKILISTKDKKLFGIIFLDAKEKITSKHRFNKYVNIKGFEFPSEVIRINYFDNHELYELTSYRKILIDETGNDNYYDYEIPKE